MTILYGFAEKCKSNLIWHRQDMWLAACDSASLLVALQVYSSSVPEWNMWVFIGITIWDNPGLGLWTSWSTILYLQDYPDNYLIWRFKKNTEKTIRKCRAREVVPLIYLKTLFFLNPPERQALFVIESIGMSQQKFVRSFHNNSVKIKHINTV